MSTAAYRTQGTCWRTGAAQFPLYRQVTETDYVPDAEGDRILDFSGVGYRGRGTEMIPIGIPGLEAWLRTVIMTATWMTTTTMFGAATLDSRTAGHNWACQSRTTM